MTQFSNAEWIIDPRARPAPVFRKTFTAHGAAAATLAATAMGVYEITLNGARVDDGYMKPGWTEYKTRLQYQEFDVADALRDGENTLCVCVAPGWCVGEIGHEGYRNFWAKQVECLAQLTITDHAGNTQVIATDESWQVGIGEVIESELYAGEQYDARRTPRDWVAVARSGRGKENLIPQEGAPVRVADVLPPVALIRTPKGERVLDFGQNMTGTLHIELTAHAGDRVELSCAEVLDADGNFYTENYRSAQSKIRYLCKEGAQEYEPRLTFFGFRYIRLDAWPGAAESLADCSGVSARVLHTEMKRIGRFQCSDPLVNQLFQNIIWGQKGNFLDIPTDCPQRNERLGWTGDVLAFAKCASYNFDVDRFFRKWLRDMAASQSKDGAIPYVVPDVFRKPEQRASAAWGDAAVFCPWQMYVSYGDRALLSELFPCMQKWVEYIRAQGEDECLWNTGWHFGDWLALDLDEETFKKQAAHGVYTGATDMHLIAPAFYAQDVAILVKAGEALGKDMREYRVLHEKIRAAFQKEFIRDGMITSDTQTAWVLALRFGLLDDPTAGARHLVALLSETGHMTTGFVGTPHLLHVLHENGYTEEAYSLLLRRDYPSWLYPVTKGATTMWEHWDGIRPDGTLWSADMNSFNHYAYGAVGDWMYEVAAGIAPDEAQPGFAHIHFAPAPDRRLQFVRASIETQRGTVASEWEIHGDTVCYCFHVPRGATAEIRIAGQQFSVREGEHRYQFPYGSGR